MGSQPGWALGWSSSEKGCIPSPPVRAHPSAVSNPGLREPPNHSAQMVQFERSPRPHTSPWQAGGTPPLGGQRAGTGRKGEGDQGPRPFNSEVMGSHRRAPRRDRGVPSVRIMLAGFFPSAAVDCEGDPAPSTSWGAFLKAEGWSHRDAHLDLPAQGCRGGRGEQE